jgi:hypothetical protein
MPRRRKVPDDPAPKPVPDEVLNAFAPDGMLTPQDVEAAMRRFRKRSSSARWGRS